MGIFDVQHKTKAHILEAILVLGAMGLSVGRIILAEFPMSNADTMALGMVSYAPAHPRVLAETNTT